MSVAHLFFSGKVADADTSEFITGQQFDMKDPGFAALANVAALCSRANFKPGQEDVPILKRFCQLFKNSNKEITYAVVSKI